MGPVVTIISNNFNMWVHIEDGKLVLAGADDETLQFSEGTVATIAGQVHALDSDCFRQIGGIGLLCRNPDPELALEVRGISASEAGTLLLRVTQAQVEAVSPGNQVHASADGRVAVILLADGNIIVSMGPDDAGKVYHVILQQGLAGRIIGTADSVGGPPGTPLPRAAAERTATPTVTPIPASTATATSTAMPTAIATPTESTSEAVAPWNPGVTTTLSSTSCRKAKRQMRLPGTTRFPCSNSSHSTS